MFRMDFWSWPFITIGCCVFVGVIGETLGNRRPTRARVIGQNLVIVSQSVAALVAILVMAAGLHYFSNGLWVGTKAYSMLWAYLFLWMFSGALAALPIMLLIVWTIPRSSLTESELIE